MSVQYRKNCDVSSAEPLVPHTLGSCGLQKKKKPWASTACRKTSSLVKLAKHAS